MIPPPPLPNKNDGWQLENTPVLVNIRRCRGDSGLLAFSWGRGGFQTEKKIRIDRIASHAEANVVMRMIPLYQYLCQ